MIKAIIFDCFGVLTKDWWREFCSTLDDEEALSKAKELNHQYDAGLLSLEDFVNGVHEATGRAPEPIEAMFTVPKALKNDELLSYIRSELKQKYKISLLSNVGTNWIRESFLNADEQALFDDFVLSYEVKTTKPHPEIFEIALQRLGIEPSEAVFIDDVDSYCQAAHALGIKAIVYQNFQQMKHELEDFLAAVANK